MEYIKCKIEELAGIISKNIEQLEEQRGLLSANILQHSRNLVEHICIMVYLKDTTNSEEEVNQDTIKQGLKHIKKYNKYQFLNEFHRLLQMSASHYITNEDGSERLMLKYYEYYLRIKKMLGEEYDLLVLQNLCKFKINLDEDTKKYYTKILDCMKNYENYDYYSYNNSQRYYIQSKKTVIIEDEIFYEVVFTKATDTVSKFDRVVAFSKFDIPSYYAIKLSLKECDINIFEQKVPIKIIEHYEISIRPCEISKLFLLVTSKNIGIRSKDKEYQGLMNFLTHTGTNLTDIFSNEEDYLYNKKMMEQYFKIQNFSRVFEKCYDIISNNKNGANTLKYLLYNLNNNIIKKQFNTYSNEDNNPSNSWLSYLNLDNKCLRFERLPYYFSLVNHNPPISTVLRIMETLNEDELFARMIKNNMKTSRSIFYKLDNENEKKIKEYVEQFNSKIDNIKADKGESRLIVKNGYVHINKYKKEMDEILELIKVFQDGGVLGYEQLATKWLNESNLNIDCEEKRDLIKKVFKKGKILALYGSAGTGKSTLINYISNIFKDFGKIYLANTNTALDNLKQKISDGGEKIEFKTISSYVSSDRNLYYSVMIIDECSMISNRDMLQILRKFAMEGDVRILILAGDTNQIEAITFGYWFEFIRELISKDMIATLTKPYRTNKKSLIKLWDKVKNVDIGLTEYIVQNDYANRIEQLFKSEFKEDEIILCLNYNGLYGINNINTLLQSKNNSKSIKIGVMTYKENDPIVFNENNRFAPLLYNNLKGKIVNIIEKDDLIEFQIKVSLNITSMHIEQFDGLQLIHLDDESSTISFEVSKKIETDNDTNKENEVPFQISYAMSIHKVQGLEYNSVKVVISEEVDEAIDLNIFYTAITRAKRYLKIYWSPEVQEKVIKNLKQKSINNEINIFSGM